MTSQHSHVVGFVGLGTMGMGMACTLVKAGFRVQGYDINPAALRTFVEAGGTGVSSVAAAAEGADALVIVVVNAAQAEELLFGAGAAEALPPGSVVILSSTVKPAFAQQTASRLYALGQEMIDAPVSGGMVKAAEGSLTIMASGHPVAFEKAHAVLTTLAAQVYRVGDACGQASTVKMVNQLLAGVHIAAAAEAMAFGVKAGVDPDLLYTIISNSAGSSWMFHNRVPHMLAGDYTPLSAVEIFVKDLGIVLETGTETRFPLPLSAIAHQLFLAAAAAGLGQEDDAAVVKVFEQVAHISVTKKQ